MRPESGLCRRCYATSLVVADPACGYRCADEVACSARAADLVLGGDTPPGSLSDEAGERLARKLAHEWTVRVLLPIFAEHGFVRVI